MSELYNLKHKQLPLQRSYDQITKIKLALFRIIDNEETEQLAIRVRQRVVSQACLSAFLAGLRGNLSAIVRAFRPTGLEEAYDMAMKERNLYFAENATYSVQNRQPNRQNDRFPPNQYSNQYQYKNYNQYQNRDNNRYGRTNRTSYDRTNYNTNRNNNFPQITAGDDVPSTSSAAAKRNSSNNNRAQSNGQRLFNIETKNKAEETQVEHNLVDEPNFQSRASSHRKDS